MTKDKMPCRITDDPYHDYSDYIEGKGVYAPYPDDDYFCDKKDLDVSTDISCANTPVELHWDPDKESVESIHDKLIKILMPTEEPK